MGSGGVVGAPAFTLAAVNAATSLVLRGAFLDSGGQMVKLVTDTVGPSVSRVIEEYVMSIAATLEEVGGVDSAILESMVEPDPHRPGQSRYRLRTENIPIWPLLGQIGAIGGTTEPEKITPQTIAQVARDYDIPTVAVAAAVHYYVHNRCPIDTLLEENAAALR